jgi:capsular exopolysaccharide synthesis family protein
VPQFVNLFPKPPDRTPDPLSPAFKNPNKLTNASSLETVRVQDVKIQEGCRLVVHTDPRGPGADRFRYLRIRLRDPWETGKLKTVLITSALPQDGKSTISLNLASSLCEHGRKRVLLLEADLHRPCLESLLGLESDGGLVECLESGESPMPFIRRLQPLGWYLLAAGGKCQNPTELLQSGALSELLSKLTPHFDWILIDSPPVIPVTDAISVAREVDAVLMVVRAGSTPRHAVERSVSLLGRKKLLAVILNGIEGLTRMYSKYGYYSNDLTKRGSQEVRGG